MTALQLKALLSLSLWEINVFIPGTFPQTVNGSRLLLEIQYVDDVIS